ncbi:cyclopropane-fatty-acyl-phospholipid synthase [Exidia glandulosa HHB12029]|uniref:Cyclopropane-fatty-acyl-phospholipid synthase n=1 Tax=Exidia glandulosa HHB12029 TaxID=1314781 RepID=A0A165C766_EXIGL|nr:cyclopropane-fatty-acyl-phospholipid synthase [Exidia glandulosa HHB12029]KZV84525.1 cyclopropane-fatty-acyl-phospholipid synthase [Exidia glandulosa HHB12029]
MSQRLLATASTHSESLISYVDKACTYALDTVLGAGSGPVARIAELAVTNYLSKMRHGHLRIVTPSHVYSYPLPGSGPHNEHPSLHAELKVVHDSFWTRMMTMSDLGFAEAYMYGEVDVDDLQSLFKIFIVNRALLSSLEGSRFSKLFTAVPHYLTNSRFANTLSTSRSNISAHYDISNRMFEGFLSKDMMYSCAIFEDLDADLRRPPPQKYNPVIDKLAGLKGASESSECSSSADESEVDDLHIAQQRKLQHILGKAKIRDGHRVLEIGSGWGEMAIQACKSANCEVDTLTLSSEQKILAEKRIAEAGLSHRIRVHLMDYRKMPESWKHSFDRVISIEMVEAVGIEFLDCYFATIDWALKEQGGVGVIQGITMPETLFPGGICPTISLLVSSLTKGSKNRLIVDSVENIGPHYARTLREWARRFDDCFDDVIAPTLREEHPNVMDGERGAKELEIFRRKWIYYCEIGFLSRTLGDHIMTFTREADSSYGCNVFA